MAEYRIAFSCGHTVEKQLFGKHEDRQRYIAWAEIKGDCPDCVAADRVKKLEGIEIENGLPALAGSEKQIAWARTIRAEKVNEISKWFDEVRATVPAEKRDLFEEQCAVTLQSLLSKASASWWIDRRDKAERAIASEAFRDVTP